MIEQAARAAHHAHGRGVLHRDLKPANILVTPEGRARVADFGLAGSAHTDAATARLTQSGVVIGTPAYMPPEQAQARGLDARADVYALGASLYEALVGETPFAGDSMFQILARVLREEVTPPRRRDSRVPADLDTIVCKCLEKDPAQRYPTAEALANDLRAFLDARPIAARPLSRLARGRRWARRHRAVVTVAAVGVAALLVVGGGLSWRVLSTGARAARAEQAAAEAQQVALAQLARQAGLAFAAALDLRRAGAVEAMARYLAETERAAEEALRVVPDSPEPDHHVGRILSLAGRYDEALAAQERALRLDPGHARARFEQLALRARRYRNRLRELTAEALRRAGEALVRGDDSALATARDPAAMARVADADPEARALRAAIEADAGAMATGAGLGPGASPCARGIAAMHGGDLAAAETAFQAAMDADPDLEEARLGLLGVHALRGAFDAALAVADAAVTHDRGCAAYRRERAALRTQLAGDQEARGVAADDLFDGAVEDLTTAIEASPGNVELRRERAHVLSRRVRAQAMRRIDPEPHLQAAVRDLQAVLERSPADAMARVALGHLHADRAQWQLNTGGTPHPHWDAALRELDAAVAADPDQSLAFAARANVHSERARGRLQFGQPADDALAAADADFGEALRRDPTNVDLWSARGRLHANWALADAQAGRDAAPRYEAAARDLREALAHAPGQLWLHRDLGTVFRNWSQHDERRGLDPTPRLRDADAALAAALAVKPDDPTTLHQRGALAFTWGQAVAGREPPEPHWERARAAFSAAIAADATLAPAWRDRGLTGIVMAKRRVDLTGDAGGGFASAVADLREATRLWPHDGAAWRDLGIALLESALDEARQGQDPLALAEEAAGALDRAVEHAPADARAFVQRARARGMAAHYWAVRGQVDRARFEAVVADCRRALALDPRVAPELAQPLAVCRQYLGE